MSMTMDKHDVIATRVRHHEINKSNSFALLKEMFGPKVLVLQTNTFSVPFLQLPLVKYSKTRAWIAQYRSAYTTTHTSPSHAPAIDTHLTRHIQLHTTNHPPHHKPHNHHNAINKTKPRHPHPNGTPLRRSSLRPRLSVYSLRHCSKKCIYKGRSTSLLPQQLACAEEDMRV